MRISDWSSDVCSSDLPGIALAVLLGAAGLTPAAQAQSAGPNPQSGEQMRAANRNAGFDDGCETARSSRIAPVQHRAEAASAASESYKAEERPVGEKWGRTCRSRGSPSQ